MSLPPRRRVSVHPRVCGERAPSAHPRPHSRGSSPRVRGTLSFPPDEGRNVRFIPACAGNARGRCVAAWAWAVHPRVCGERTGWGEAFGGTSGSSPRVRGTLDHVRRVNRINRFIPACAGNAWRGTPSPMPSAVHPRVCGERCLLVGGGVIPDGSSPRVRGTRAWPLGLGRFGRFIPACAGNARPRTGTPSTYSVHPRVCGER